MTPEEWATVTRVIEAIRNTAPQWTVPPYWLGQIEEAYNIMVGEPDVG